MPMYTVVQGDCLSAIAHKFGFADWRTIYNHGNNAEFRRLRPIIRHLRFDDDLVVFLVPKFLVPKFFVPKPVFQKAAPGQPPDQYVNFFFYRVATGFK